MKVIKILTALVATLTITACVSTDRRSAALPDIDSNNVPRKNVTIAMLGATGMSGGFIIREALSQGYDIRALARTPQKLAALKDHITIIEGDARNLLAIDALLQGSDIVISSLGPTKADGKAANTVSATATGHIIQLIPKHNIGRYLLVSGAAVDIPGDERNLTGWLMRKLALLALNDTVKDKQAEYQLLADSDIQWTLIRCPLIKDKPFKHQPRASLVTPSSFSLRAGELAHFMIEQINSEVFIKKAPFLDSQ